MPGLRGTDVLLEIDRRRLTLPSVLITGAVDHEVTAAAQRLGAMTVMVKPILSDELLGFVETAVGWSPVPSHCCMGDLVRACPDRI